MGPHGYRSQLPFFNSAALSITQIWQCLPDSGVTKMGERRESQRFPLKKELRKEAWRLDSGGNFPNTSKAELETGHAHTFTHTHTHLHTHLKETLLPERQVAEKRPGAHRIRPSLALLGCPGLLPQNPNTGPPLEDRIPHSLLKAL